MTDLGSIAEYARYGLEVGLVASAIPSCMNVVATVHSLTYNDRRFGFLSAEESRKKSREEVREYWKTLHQQPLWIQAIVVLGYPGREFAYATHKFFNVGLKYLDRLIPSTR